MGSVKKGGGAVGGGVADGGKGGWDWGWEMVLGANVDVDVGGECDGWHSQKVRKQKSIV